METMELIGLGFVNKNSSQYRLEPVLDNFPWKPCYTGPLEIKSGGHYEHVILWKFRKPNNGSWNLADSFIEHFFIDLYKVIDSLCKSNEGMTLFSTDELGEVFRFGPFDSSLSLDFLCLDKKDHKHKSTRKLKWHLEFVFRKYKQKSEAYFCMLDLLNNNSSLEEGIVPFVELYLKEIYALIGYLARNKKALTNDDGEKYLTILEKIQIQTEATAMSSSVHDRKNFLSCWRTPRIR